MTGPLGTPDLAWEQEGQTGGLAMQPPAAPMQQPPLPQCLDLTLPLSNHLNLEGPGMGPCSNPWCYFCSGFASCFQWSSDCDG